MKYKKELLVLVGYLSHRYLKIYDEKRKIEDKYKYEENQRAINKKEISNNNKVKEK